jgi:hypothetical protein
MRVIEIAEKPKSTQECIDLLNEFNLLSYTWKRRVKYKLGEIEVRVFENEDGENNTIVTGKFVKTRVFNDLDFSRLKDLIEVLKKVAKFYFTHDYGCVYLNPYTLDLIAVGGDGGFGYSTKPKSYFQRKIDNDEDIDWDKDFDEYVEFNQHVGLESIKSVEWEAESIPLNPEFIEICEISIL